MSIARTLIALLALASAALAAEPKAADPDKPLANPLAEENALVEIMPQLKKMKAPGWIKPGLRLTYKSSSALAGMTGVETKEEGPSIYSGAGFVQLDIGAVGDNSVAVDSKIWTIDPTGQFQPTIGHFAGRPVLPSAGADYWVHPDALKELVDRPIQPVRAQRMKYTIGKKTYDAIRLETGRGTGAALRSWTYDADTGMLLLASTATRLKYAKGKTTTGGITDLKRSEFIDSRQTDWPWAKDELPDWARKIKVMKFTGVQRVTAPTGFIDIPVAGLFTLGKPAANFLPYHQTFAIQSVPVPLNVEYDRISAPGALGGLYIAPKTLAKLKPATVLDDDAVTGIRTATGKFADTDPTRTIAEYNKHCMIEYTYDAKTGMLVGLLVSQQSSGLVTKLTLQGTE